MEGETYIMHNFKILKNEGQYRVCEHPYKLLFIGATSVKSQAIPKVSMKDFVVKSIKEIVSGNFSGNFIPDLLIGMRNIITVLFLFKFFLYDCHTNRILYILSLRFDWCR